MCVGDTEILINSDYSSEFVKELKKETKLDVFKISNEEFKATGGVIRFLNGRYYVSQEMEKDDVKPILKKIAGIGSVNSGAAFVSSGIVGNSKGLILGSLCSTVEIQDIVESLDYLD
jgi:translation initiation factor 6 (eIF-6)